jgi:hypothetical protein
MYRTLLNIAVMSVPVFISEMISVGDIDFSLLTADIWALIIGMVSVEIACAVIGYRLVADYSVRRAVYVAPALVLVFAVTVSKVMLAKAVGIPEIMIISGIGWLCFGAYWGLASARANHIGNGSKWVMGWAILGWLGVLILSSIPQKQTIVQPALAA